MALRLSEGLGLSEAVLHLVRVDDKPGMGTYFVVQRAPWCVGGVREPVNPAAAVRECCFVDGLNETAPDSLTSHFLGGEEILQVADVMHPRGAPMEQVVNKSYNDTVTFRDKGMNRVRRIEESLPCGLGDLLRQRRDSFALVEGVVAIP